MNSATITSRAPVPRAAAVLADARALIVAAVVAMAAFDPNFALRAGAVMCALIVFSYLRRMRIGLTEVLAVCYALLVAASIQWTADTASTVLATKNTIACITILVAVRLVVTRLRDVKLVGYGFLCGCVISIALTVQENTGLKFRLEYHAATTRVGLADVNFNYTAYTLATAGSVVALFLVMRSTARLGFGRPALYATAMILYAGLLFNGTRGALISFALLGIWWVFGRARPWTSYRILWGVVIVVNLLVFTGRLDHVLASSVGQSARDTGDLNGRLAVWPIARDAIGGHWLIGQGADVLPALAANHLGIAAHNAWFDIGVGLGTPGILLFSGLLYSMLHRDTRNASSPSRQVVVGAFIVVTAPILLSGYWTESPAFWAALALFSRVSVIDVKPGLPTVESPTSRPLDGQRAAPAVPGASSSSYEEG
jgi:O-antigen ligase